MLVPIKHENMAARRWPVVTLALIAINTVAFLFTTMSMSDEAPQLGEVKADILILAALASGTEDPSGGRAAGRGVQEEPSGSVEAGAKPLPRRHQRL